MYYFIFQRIIKQGFEPIHLFINAIPNQERTVISTFAIVYVNKHALPTCKYKFLEQNAYLL